MVAESGPLVAESMSTRQMGLIISRYKHSQHGPSLREDIGSADYSYFLPILVLYKLVSHNNGIHKLSD